jgi:catechol 2,3-dioxygenase-like lactoylglutathione lyase family enzyme
LRVIEEYNLVVKNPVYHSCVILVDDIEKSKHFYNTILGQSIVNDFGRNVVFEGGLSIWQRDYALNLIFQGKTEEITAGRNNFELYFETEDLDNLYDRLVSEKVEIIHSVIEHSWGQRGFRVHDPEGHIVEFSESMESVVRRLNMQGLSVEEIFEKSMMPMEFIEMALKKQ